VPPQARYLIALVAATLVRGFLNQQTPVISILRNPQSFLLLQSVFRPLGQVEPVELGPSRKLTRQTLAIENFSKYPLFATCLEMKALDGIDYPLFLLCKSGLALSEPTDSETRLRITSLSHRVITSVVLNLVRDPVQAQALSGSEAVPPMNELAFEGKRAIEASGGIERFDLLERELPLLEKVLSQIAPETAPQYFRYDRDAGLVFISCRKLPQVTRKPLYAELIAKNQNVKLRGSHYLSCPGDWFLDVLGKFYGHSIHLSSRPTYPKAGLSLLVMNGHSFADCSALLHRPDAFRLN